jgi:hypothetical protein
MIYMVVNNTTKIKGHNSKPFTWQVTTLPILGSTTSSLIESRGITFPYYI